MDRKEIERRQSLWAAYHQTEARNIKIMFYLSMRKVRYAVLGSAIVSSLGFELLDKNPEGAIISLAIGLTGLGINYAQRKMRQAVHTKLRQMDRDLGITP